jgi:hypothetical protein
MAALAVLATACALGSAGDNHPRPEADPLHHAMDQLTGVIVYDIFSPPQAARVYAYSSAAAYEVVRHADTSYRSLAGQVNGLRAVPEPPSGREISLPLAGMQAFLSVGRQLTFSRARMDSVIAQMQEDFRRNGVRGETFDLSIEYGNEVAKHILAWASEDGYTKSRGMPKYTVTSDPGRWIPTPPAYMDGVEPNWATLRPFTMSASDQFRPEPPFPFDTARTSAFFREVLEVYETGRKLTPEQRDIAAFWDCNPYVMHVQGHTMFATKKITPGGHWISIVGLASRQAGASLVATAEAYALTAMALSDGFVSSWDEKYRSNVIRPETAINSYLDEAWQPLLQTPPFPEYTSGHSVISTAAAVVLTSLFGEDFAFDDSSEVSYGLPVRRHASFRAAADEAAMSRLYGGIHYRRAIEQGIVQGRRVGENAVRRVQTRADRATTVAAGDAARQQSH